MRPIIGITTYLEPVRWSVLLDGPAVVLPISYVDAVERAGGRPVLLPPLASGAAEAVDTLDGLVLAGGADIDPARYVSEPAAETASIRPERDEAEIALLRHALDRDVALLGICRGMQLLNVVHGGDLVQHLPHVVNHDGHRESPAAFSDHGVDVAEGSLLAGLVGRRVSVKSHHHQGVGRIGDGLVASAWADDGLVEALERSGHRFALGVLWHPEAEGDPRLFDGLVRAARAYRAARGRKLAAHRGRPVHARSVRRPGVQPDPLAHTQLSDRDRR